MLMLACSRTYNSMFFGREAQHLMVLCFVSFPLRFYAEKTLRGCDSTSECGSNLSRPKTAFRYPGVERLSVAQSAMIQLQSPAGVIEPSGELTTATDPPVLLCQVL